MLFVERINIQHDDCLNSNDIERKMALPVTFHRVIKQLFSAWPKRQTQTNKHVNINSYNNKLYRSGMMKSFLFRI
jgi:hypothetical protein